VFDPYACKASYVCGMVRQFIEAAGLQLRRQYHVGAPVSAASATELLGWWPVGLAWVAARVPCGLPRHPTC